MCVGTVPVAKRVRARRDAGLRRCLLEEAKAFWDCVVSVHRDENSRLAWVAEGSGELDRLAAGGEWRLTRRDLPFGHPLRAAGGLDDELVLGADDVLRPA